MNADDAWIPKTKNLSGTDRATYNVAAQGADEIIYLVDDGLLAVKIVDEVTVRFAIFEFSSSELDGSDAEHAMVAHGSGPSGSLRECRHIWWGENGYTCYLSFPIVEAALRELRRWFDA